MTPLSASDAAKIWQVLVDHAGAYEDPIPGGLRTSTTFVMVQSTTGVRGIPVLRFSRLRGEVQTQPGVDRRRVHRVVDGRLLSGGFDGRTAGCDREGERGTGRTAKERTQQ